jgi:hypothetical protein
MSRVEAVVTGLVDAQASPLARRRAPGPRRGQPSDADVLNMAAQVREIRQRLGLDAGRA